MRKGIIAAIAAPVLLSVLLAGCGTGNSPATNIPAQPKWQGTAYHLEFGAPPAKPNPAGLTIPPIKFKANPDALENRVDLVIEFDNSGAKKGGELANRMIMAPTDISGAEGALPTDYVDKASHDLTTMLAAYCMKGKIKISIAIARSTLSLTANQDQIDAHRVSDWMPIELTFKNPHPKC